MQEHGFDMLAGAEPVDSKISACAGEYTLGQGSQLYAIGHPASRDHFKLRENPPRRFKVSNPWLLFEGASLSELDFLLIGCSPIEVASRFNSFDVRTALRRAPLPAVSLNCVHNAS
jgi:hypothetical protein